MMDGTDAGRGGGESPCGRKCCQGGTDGDDRCDSHGCSRVFVGRRGSKDLLTSQKHFFLEQIITTS